MKENMEVNRPFILNVVHDFLLYKPTGWWLTRPGQVPVWVQCCVTPQWISNSLWSVCVWACVVEDTKPAAECNVSIQYLGICCRHSVIVWKKRMRARQQMSVCAPWSVLLPKRLCVPPTSFTVLIHLILTDGSGFQPLWSFVFVHLVLMSSEPRRSRGFFSYCLLCVDIQL